MRSFLAGCALAILASALPVGAQPVGARQDPAAGTPGTTNPPTGSGSAMDHGSMDHGAMNRGAETAAQGADVPGAAAMPVTTGSYLTMAASGDQFEIQSSRLALQRSRSDGVRRFAQMLITDHTRMTGELKSAAASARAPAPPATLSAKHADMLARLRGTSASGFNAAYRDAQVAAHQEALALHRSYAQQGDADALRGVATRAVPIIEQHLQAAQALPAG